MELSISKALVIYQENGRLVGANFLKKSGFECTNFVLKILHHVSEGTPYQELATKFSDTTAEYLYNNIDALVELGALVKANTPGAREEKDKLGDWDWGLPASLFHFSAQDSHFVSSEEAEELQLDALEAAAQPPLFKLNHPANDIAPLRKPTTDDNLISIMAKRRSVREGDDRTITLDMLSDCLYAGLGITDFVENCAGKLPLGMTPSGGARNPYEAYVYVNSVTGLSPGVYHYSAVEHNLSRINDTLLHNASELLADQAWADNMACIIFLCAYFERTMWKYKDDRAYQVVLIEAGHIGQNIMLAATKNNCTACPTAALAQGKISTQLDLKSPTHSPVYALAVGAI